MAEITKVLVANRGEIAVRVIRACRELGIPTVAVYSSLDRRSVHVQLADEAREIGPPLPTESYLNIDNILEAARDTGADAIHPGYGFLAENPTFARTCMEHGVAFIGPSADAISLLGNKIASRELAERSDVPVIPGTMQQGLDDEAIAREAEVIGYPVLIKAAAGGGGKGMRIVANPDELQDAIEGARRVAMGAFGDATVFIEKLVVEPRHVEFQIMADHHGNVVHLFERECSIQRRHQKVVEESPSPAVTPEIRQRMGEAAVKLARAAEYTNAGTVEFLLDRNGDFYFLEMNTRIQVEHPVTEMVVGVDLVHEQLRVARGEELSFEPAALRQRGHAIEARIYAEDPAQGFLPSPGLIHGMREPSGPGVRNDCGVRTGDEVSVHYDPILSKLVTWAPTRERAIARMLQALDDYVILGPKTTISFLHDVIGHQAFGEGRTFTNFIQEHFPEWKDERKSLRHIALIAAALSSTMRPTARADGAPRTQSPWTTVGDWEIGKGV